MPHRPALEAAAALEHGAPATAPGRALRTDADPPPPRGDASAPARAGPTSESRDPASRPKRHRTGPEAAADVRELAARLGLTGPLGGDPPPSAAGAGGNFVAELRDSLRQRATTATDLPRLRTALGWFRSFLSATQGRTPFVPALGADATRGQMYNAETLELFAEYIRRSAPRGRTKGERVTGDAISGYVSAIRIFRSREAGYAITQPDLSQLLPLALKAMRREDGPPGARSRSVGVRASHFDAAAAAGFDRTSVEGAVDWAAGVTAHNAILRGGEVGIPDNAVEPDVARVITWASISWQPPRAESGWRPWLILRVVPIKDPRGSKSAYPIPVARRHDGAFGADPLCPYDAVALAWWLRAGPAGAPFPTVDGRPAPGWWSDATPRRSSFPFFTAASGDVMDTSYVRRLAQRIAAAAGMPGEQVRSDVGAKAFRIGGATDWRAERGEAGVQIVKQRGRWDSDVASIYQRPLLADQLAASAAVGGVRGSDLEQVCLAFAQRAVR